MDFTSEPPEPHPLDFDWRFDVSTIESLGCLLAEGRRVVSFGAPSVARYLSAQGVDVVLVDRQPFQNVPAQIVAEPGPNGVYVPDASIAIVDPPWYPDDIIRWAACAGRVVGPGHRVLVSIWPEGARPSEGIEYELVIDHLSRWASVAESSVRLCYDEPPFERAARKVAQGAALSSSPRHGRLLELHVDCHPRIPPWPGRRERWARFVLDEYQLALRVDSQLHGDGGLSGHPGALGWTWPFVSRRAPGRDRIDLWSSHNEVAIVGDPNGLLMALRMAFESDGERDFGVALADFSPILSWDIPRPPYRRFSEWSHLQ
jgi:hypothetical protein